MDSIELVQILAASIQIGVVTLLMFCALLAKRARQDAEPVPVLLTLRPEPTKHSTALGVAPAAGGESLALAMIAPGRAAKPDGAPRYASRGL